MKGLRVDVRQRQALYARELFRQPFCKLDPSAVLPVQLFQLLAADGRLSVRHPVIEADIVKIQLPVFPVHGVLFLIHRKVFVALSIDPAAQRPVGKYAFIKLPAVGRYKAALSQGRHVLLLMKAEYAHVPQAACLFSLVFAAGIVGAVFDYCQAVFIGYFHDPIHFAALAVQVYRHDCLCPAGDSPLQRPGIEIQREGIHVSENHPGPQCRKRRRGGYPADGRGYHLVSGLYAGSDSRQGQARGGGCYGKGIFRMRNCPNTAMTAVILLFCR